MKIYLSSKADKQLKSLLRQMYQVIIGKIEKLKAYPYPTGTKKLEARPAWRIRVGDYRILYTIDQQKQEITVLSVAHKKEAYRH